MLRLRTTTYHDESPEGRDIYKVWRCDRESGRFAGLVNGKVIKVRPNAEKSANGELLSSSGGGAVGPLRTIVELEYGRVWKPVGEASHLRSRITQWAGERGFTHAIFAKSAGTISNSRPACRPKAGIEPLTSNNALRRPMWLATLGRSRVVGAGELRRQKLFLGNSWFLRFSHWRPPRAFANDGKEPPD